MAHLAVTKMATCAVSSLILLAVVGCLIFVGLESLIYQINYNKQRRINRILEEEKQRLLLQKALGDEKLSDDEYQKLVKLIARRIDQDPLFKEKVKTFYKKLELAKYDSKYNNIDDILSAI